MNELATAEYSPSVYSSLNTQMDAIQQLGLAITKSGFAGCEKIEQGVIIAFTCLAEKITPIEFSRTYDLIHGQPTKKASVMLAEFRSQHGGDFDWIDDGEDGKKATIQIIYKGKQKKPVSFTLEEAKTKGLANKTNYKMHLPEMLRARAITKALRMYVPEIAAGIYDPYEVDANATVEKLLNTPVEESTDYVKSVKNLVAERPEEQQKQIMDILKKKFKIAELDSLNQGQAEKVCNGWEAFMESL